MVVRGITFGYLTVIAIAIVALSLPLPDNTRGDSFLKIALFVIPLFVCAQPLRLILKRHPSPTRQLIEDARANWPKLLWAGAIYLSLALTLEAFSGIKKSIPSLMPFYLDPFLIELDRVLFFGTDPWRITHAVFGWATQPIVWLYNAWHFVHIGLAVWVAFSLDEIAKIRFTLLLQFIWVVLGGGAALLMSSVGPVMVGDFFADRSFDPLLVTLQERAPSVIAIKDALIATMDNPLLISGISAMPSIHVAISVAAALWLQRYRLKLLAFVGWAYAAVIYVGSIHLGWHYATDGLFSAPAVLLVWWLAGKYVAWLDGRELVLGRRPTPVRETSR
jgi:hypothetical protein